MDRDTFNIGRSFQNGVDTMFNYLPQLVGAIVLLILGYFIAKILAAVVRKLLTKLRFDRALHVSPAGNYISRVIESPTKLLSKTTYWVVFLLFLSMAVTALNVPALDALVLGVYSYIPKVIAAILIFLVASAITAGAEAFVLRVLGKGPSGKIVGAILPAIILSIAVFMILNQLLIAKDIVNITYTAIMGAIALGLALAFGLGGRDVASEILRNAYDTTINNKDVIKSEARRAKENAKNL